MLTTLVNGGPKGGRWFSLIDKVWNPANLESAWMKVQRNKGAPGADRQSTEAFGAHAATHLQEIATSLREGKHQPAAVLRKLIPKPGTDKMRPLGIPTVKDRIVQGALRHVLEPLWEARFADHSYGFRPNRSCHDALRRVDGLLKSGHSIVIDADIQSYFDEIDKDLLMDAISEVVSDGRVLELLRSYLDQKVLDECKEWVPIKGTPQGAVISPLLANIYLHTVDTAIREAGFEMVRYADDLVIMCRNEEDAQRAFALLKEHMARLRLKLHPEKTRLVDMRTVGSGFDFLGYRFETGRNRPLKKVRKKSYDSLKDKIRALTPANAGRSVQMIALDLNRMLRGWFNYFKHCSSFMFVEIDGFVRRRLRSILRRQQHLRGTSHGHGADHQRWPIAFFTEKVGLYSLTRAWQDLRQPRCGKH